ncbi:MAG TPA: hypothetical protein VHS59_11020 [Bacillota bacterium]|nr:hypothetical protein [Bacillota bacterium]
MKQKRLEKLKQKAKEKGVTTEELKKRMTERHNQRIENMAKDLGLTVDQLKQILPANLMEKH